MQCTIHSPELRWANAPIRVLLPAPLGPIRATMLPEWSDPFTLYTIVLQLFRVWLLMVKFCHTNVTVSLLEVHSSDFIDSDGPVVPSIILLTADSFPLLYYMIRRSEASKNSTHASLRMATMLLKHYQ